MNAQRQIYLPDFDRHAEVQWGWRSDLQRQLVYGVLTHDRVLISAASPFKNRGGWGVIDRYKALLDHGLVRFPLDPRYDGKVGRYIANRIKVVPANLRDGTRNPEYVAYTDSGADTILTETDDASYTCKRVADCDSVFRRLVLDDLASQQRNSLAHCLDGFRNIRTDAQEAQALVRGRAIEMETLFQRFDLVSSMPDAIRRNDAYRMRLERRLDALFFQANGRAASDGHIVTGFEGSLAEALQAFCTSYSPGALSLDRLITRLPADALFRLKFSDGFQEFLGELHEWLNDMESWTAVASDLGHRRAFRDAILLGWGRTLLLSVFAASLSWPGGLAVETLVPISSGLAGWVASVVVGCLPIVTRSLRSSSAAQVYRSAALRSHIDAQLDSLSATQVARGIDLWRECGRTRG